MSDLRHGRKLITAGIITGILIATTAASGALRQHGIDPSILDDPARSDDDRYRDQGFKPVDVYSFFGIEAGMTIADLWPSRGYHTRLLSAIAGDNGKVVAILVPYAGDEESTTRRREGLQQSLAGSDLSNLEIVGGLADVAADSLDLLLTVRNYHDLGQRPDRLKALPEILRVLKPGGTFAVVDAYTDKTDERDESVHRMNDELAKGEITSGGFEFVAASDVLANPDDTYDFDGREVAGRRGATADAPIHRYFIHRWVHKYRKPLN